MTYLRLYITSILLSLFCISQAQLIVDNTPPYDNPTYLVNNVLLGGGVTATGITYSGDPSQIGWFDGSATFLGINEGLILTSGDIFSAVGPNNQGGVTGLNPALSGSDPDLNVLTSPFGAWDEAILEFDFVATGDSIKFEFIFGSDEYLEFVGSSFNDAFGFFLSGPGIAGPFTGGAENIALVPGGGGQVSINNVNDVSNSAYYVNNGDGYTAPYDTDPMYVQYDGLTVVMEARAAVQCGQTYHIKLAVCDAGDNILDSGVFLKAGSFTTTNVSVNANVDFGTNDSTMFEGCGTAVLEFVRGGDISNGEWIQLSATGTATNGVDYTFIPDSIEFLPGEDTITFNFNAFLDGIPEGTESVTITITNSSCGVTTTTAVTIYIANVDPITIILADTTLWCPGDSAFLDPIVTGGYGNYSYSWSTGSTDTAIAVSPASSTMYYLSITDTCGMTAAFDSAYVDVPPYVLPDVNLGPDITQVCPGDLVTLSGTIVGSGLTYEWTDLVGTLLGTNPTLDVTNSTTTTYILTIYDPCGLSDSDTIDVISPVYAPITIAAPNDTIVCQGNSVTLNIVASGGQGTYSYSWTNSGSTSSSATVTPTEPTTYTVTVTDICGNTASADIFVDFSEIWGDFSSQFLGGNDVHFSGWGASNIVDWYWDFGDFNYGSGQSTTHAYDDLNVYNVTLYFTNDIGCIDSITHPVYPPVTLYVPNAFSPNNDGINDIFYASGFGITEFEILIFDRWGELLFSSDNITIGWDGTVNGAELAPIGIYVYKVLYSGYEERDLEAVGHVTIVR